MTEGLFFYSYSVYVGEKQSELFLLGDGMFAIQPTHTLLANLKENIRKTQPSIPSTAFIHVTCVSRLD